MMSAPLARAASTKAFTFGTESAQRLRRSIVQVCTVKSITRSAVSFGTSVTGLSCGGVGSFAAYQSSMMVAPRATPTVSAAAVTAIAAMENTLPGMTSPSLLLRRKLMRLSALVPAERLFGAVGEANRPMQRSLFDAEKADEGNKKKDGGGQKDPVIRRCQIAVFRRKLFQCHYPRRAVDAAEHNGAKYRYDNRTAERAEKVQRSGRGAQLMRFDRVLHEDGTHRIHRSDPASECKEQGHEFGDRVACRIGSEHDQHDDSDGEPNHRHAQIARYSHHHARRNLGAADRAGHEGDQGQP